MKSSQLTVVIIILILFLFVIWYSYGNHTRSSPVMTYPPSPLPHYVNDNYQPYGQNQLMGYDSSHMSEGDLNYIWSNSH
jgi:hypothetical protein